MIPVTGERGYVLALRGCPVSRSPGRRSRPWVHHAKFLERNKKMVDFYNEMHPWEGQDFYGGIMTGEACADMAGIKVMLKIA